LPFKYQYIASEALDDNRPHVITSGPGRNHCHRNRIHELPFRQPAEAANNSAV